MSNKSYRPMKRTPCHFVVIEEIVFMSIYVAKCLNSLVGQSFMLNSHIVYNVLLSLPDTNATSMRLLNWFYSCKIVFDRRVGEEGGGEGKEDVLSKIINNDYDEFTAAKEQDTFREMFFRRIRKNTHSL